MSNDYYNPMASSVTAQLQQIFDRKEAHSAEAAKMRRAEAYAKAEIERLVGGPVTYSNTNANSWGGDHVEFSNYGDFHRSPFDAADHLICAVRDYVTGAEALEWRKAPEIEQGSTPKHNAEGVIVGHDIFYKSYMRLSVKPKEKAA